MEKMTLEIQKMENGMIIHWTVTKKIKVLQVHVHKPVDYYDKGGTVEVYGECFKLIGLFCLLHLHVS